MKIMVTGANGGYGSYAIDYVREFAPEAEVVGLATSGEKAETLRARGFEARVADYADAASMDEALAGVDRLLFVSVPDHALQRNVVDAIARSSVSFVAYTSLYDLEHVRFGLEDNHRMTEEAIAKTGTPHTFLRNGWYLEMAAPLAAAAARTGVFPTFAPDAKVAWVLKRELAEAGARVVAGEGFPERIDLPGHPVSYTEFAAAAAEATGKDISVEVVDPDEYEKALEGSGISQLGLMLGQSYMAWAAAGDSLEAQADPAAFEKLLGRPLTPLPQALSELLAGPVM